MKLHRLLACAMLLLVGCGGTSTTTSTTRTTAPIANTTVEPVGSAAPVATDMAAAQASEAATTAAAETPVAETSAPTTTAAETPAAETTTAGGANAAGAKLSVPIALPDGFTISIYAQDLGSPRFMAYGPDGTLYVTDMDGGRVLAAPDANGDGVADSTNVALTDLNNPHGIAFHDNALYIGETNQIVRFATENGAWGDKEVIVPDLPTGGHNTRTVIFGPDNKMYVSIGSSCNVCVEDTPLRAAVWQYDADGSNGRLFTAGLRNAVGIVVRPGSSDIWASNNGRDMMGDDVPPETINVLANGSDFGWPRCHAGDIVDPQYAGQNGCEGVAPPAVEMQAHSAPLGLRFYDGTMFPEAYQGSLFVAFHGSWNRTEPTGYKIVRVPVDANGQPGEPEDFASGWLQDSGAVAGRPVDVIVAPDGALLVTDDEAGMIYRIAYTGG